MLLVHLANGTTVVDHVGLMKAPNQTDEWRAMSRDRISVLEQRLAEIHYKQRQIKLIADVIHSTSFVKVHWDSTNEKAAAALYSKGMRVEEKK